MTEPLSAERRKKVAAACLKWRHYTQKSATDDEVRIFGYGNNEEWKPDSEHYSELTQTTARLIKTAGLTAEAAKKWYSTLLVDALATGDTNAIEKLCSDLLEPQDGK